MTRKASPAVYRSPELDKLLNPLEPDNKLKRWIDDMETVLLENMYAGRLIKKKQIPVQYIQQYGVNVLYRYRHPEYYRSCYTITYVEGIGICPTILDIMSHDEYNRIFGYKRR